MLVLIATYNAGDLVGRCLPLARRLRLASRRRMTAAGAAAARFLLVPAFYLAARLGGGQGYTILLMAVLGFSNGYHYRTQALCRVPVTLGKSPYTLGKGFAECNRR